MNTQRGILNFFKKVDRNKQSGESEYEECDTDVQSHSTNLTQVNNINEKIVSSYHPLENYKFLKRAFGKSKRSSWFKTYKCIHYVTKNDAVICYICTNQEFSSNLRSERKKDPAFISKRYSNWEKVIENLKTIKILIVIKQQMFHLRLQFVSAEISVTQ